MLDESKINDNEKEENMVEEVIEDFSVIESQVEEKESKPVKKEKIEKEPEEIVPGENPNFFLTIASSIVDAGIIGLVTLGGFYLVDFIMRHIFGYYVVEKAQMGLIIYIVLSVLYFSIMEAVAQFTIGKKLFGIKVSKN